MLAVLREVYPVPSDNQDAAAPNRAAGSPRSDDDGTVGLTVGGRSPTAVKRARGDGPLASRPVILAGDRGGMPVPCGYVDNSRSQLGQPLVPGAGRPQRRRAQGVVDHSDQGAE